MLGTNMLKKGIVGVALGALMLLSACTTIAPPAADGGESTPPVVVDAGSAPAAEFVLPDGTSCLFAGTGATIAFDDKRVNYTCTPLIATEGVSQTQALLGDPVVAGQTEYVVDFAVIAETDGGFELNSSQAVTFTAWQVVLADGRVCLHAGFGATMGFDGQRLNYTCDTSGSSADEVGLMGELVNQGEGVWVAQIDEIGRDANGFVQLSSTQVPVARVYGVDVAHAGGTVVDNELVGTSWQWVQTVYGDDSVLVAADPTVYTITFNDDGFVAAQFDCNTGGGSYTIDGSSLSFGPMISTMIACPDGSQATEFSADLAGVYSFVLQDGHLFLSLAMDTGIMEFAPADASAEEGGEAVSSELAGTSWQWVQTQYGDDTTEVAVDPTRYTLTFNEDGTLAVQLDCNNGFGEYTVDGVMLSFGPIASTLMGCPEDTQDFVFGQDLSSVVSYMIQDGHLFLALQYDSGIMEFAPAAADASEGSEVTAESVELAGTSWQWVQTQYGDDTTEVAVDPARYTLTFNEDGTLAVQLDCNSGRGDYTIDSPMLSFGPIASTRMGCPEDSQDAVFGRDLEAVVSYVIQDGHLFLALKFDSGIMEFAPVE